MKTKDQFVKATAVLVSGTALAHGITALSLPVLSRLYTPTDFSVLAVFSSILAIIAVAACLRFEIAIAIPQSEEEALGLLILALISACAVATVTALVVWSIPDLIVTVLKQPDIRPYLWFSLSD